MAMTQNQAKGKEREKAKGKNEIWAKEGGKDFRMIDQFIVRYKRP